MTTYLLSDKVTPPNIQSVMSKAALGKGAELALVSLDFFVMYEQSLQKSQFIEASITNDAGEKGLIYYGCGRKIEVYPDDKLNSSMEFYDKNKKLLVTVKQ